MPKDIRCVWYFDSPRPPPPPPPPLVALLCQGRNKLFAGTWKASFSNLLRDIETVVVRTLLKEAMTMTHLLTMAHTAGALCHLCSASVLKTNAWQCFLGTALCETNLNWFAYPCAADLCLLVCWEVCYPPNRYSTTWSNDQSMAALKTTSLTRKPPPGTHTFC